MVGLEEVQFIVDEDPKFFFARISRLETTMRAVGIEKSESEIVQIILRQLPERYDIVKTTTLADPQLTRLRLENTIRSAYSQRKAHEIAKQGPAAGAPAAPPNPHGLVVGRGFGAGGPGEAEANEGTTVWYFAAVACRGNSSSSSRNNTGLAAVACRGSSCSNTGLAAVACRGSSSSSSSSINGLAAVVFLISINVAPMLFLRPGRRDSSNRSSNLHGESLRSELAGSTTAVGTPYTSRRTNLPRQAHRCVRCRAVATNIGTSLNTVLHRVGLRALAAPAASMVTYGGTALPVAGSSLI